MGNDLKFSGGRNIALKVPAHAYEATVGFYRDVLGLPEVTAHRPAVVFEFGSNQLWIDREPGVSQAELWLEIQANDVDAAKQYLADARVVRCDEIESLPEDFDAFWISSPASIIHLVRKQPD